MAFISQTVRPSSTPDIVIPELACDSSVVVGDWVRLNSSNILIKAQANSFLNSNLFGLVEEKPTATLAVVRVAGISKNVFTGLFSESTYFLSPTAPGTMTTDVPSDAGEVVLILGKPLNSTQFLVQPQQRLQRS